MVTGGFYGSGSFNADLFKWFKSEPAPGSEAGPATATSNFAGLIDSVSCIHTTTGQS